MVSILKKYRLPLIFAGLLLLWLTFGAQFLNDLAIRLLPIDRLPPGLEGRLFYTQLFDGIWQVDVSSGEVSQWWQPPEGGLVTGIAASPDGSQFAIAYAPPADEGFQIGTTDLYLSSSGAPDLQTLLVRENRNESYRNPFWSPDGASLIYSHLRPNLNEAGQTVGINLNVEKITIESESEPVILVQGAEHPALSPDGTQLVYLNFDLFASVQGVWVADADGSNPRQYLPGDAFAAVASPRFSPDGQSIVVSGSGDLQRQAARIPDLLGVGVAEAHGLPWDIWQVSLDDGKLTKLTDSPLDGPWISWSPDGQHMAVLAAEGVYVRQDSRFFRLTEVINEGEITWAR